MQATYGGHKECMRVMLRHKADPDLVAKVIVCDSAHPGCRSYANTLGFQAPAQT